MIESRSRLALSVLAISAAAIPALVFSLAGFGKLHDQLPAAVFLVSTISIGFETAIELVRFLAVLELGLAAWLAYSAGRRRSAACIAAALLLFFLGLLLRLIWHHPSSLNCGCFGSIITNWLDRSLLAQAALDVSLIVLLLFYLYLFPRIREHSEARVAVRRDSLSSREG